MNADTKPEINFLGRRMDPHWSQVDLYLARTILGDDPELTEVLRTSSDAGLPPIQVSAAQGKLLHILARSCGARNILEIGTLGGYSAVWMARALPPGGRLISMELASKHAELARRNLANAGLSDRAEVRIGPALELLPELAAEKPPPFDLTFIDANKESSPEYFEWAVKLSRSGALIIVDNVVREGALANRADKSEAVAGSRRLHEAVGKDSRVSATTLQTVGDKGYDGFLIAVVR